MMTLNLSCILVIGTAIISLSACLLAEYSSLQLYACSYNEHQKIACVYTRGPAIQTENKPLLLR